MQMNGNKITFILILCMNVFDACMYRMMMVLVCKEEYHQLALSVHELWDVCNANEYAR